MTECLRCDGKDAEGCMRCNGTGIEPELETARERARRRSAREWLQTLRATLAGKEHQ